MLKNLQYAVDKHFTKREFFCVEKNNTYSNELKLEIVQAYLTGNESIADRYEIRNVSQVKAWVKKYKEVGSIEAFNRITATGSGAKGVKNQLKGKRVHFKNGVEERDYYKAQVEYLKK